MAIDRGYIASLYQNLLGRTGSESEIEGHVNNPGGEQGLYDFFISSPEYTSAHGGTASWQNDAQGNVVPADTSSTQNIDKMPIEGGGGGTGLPPAPTPTSGTPTLSQQYNPGRLGAGFMYDNFVNPQMQTPKYEFARIASGYDANPAGLQAIVNDSRFKAAFPNARMVGKDLIDFGPGIGIIDVGEAFDDKAGTGKNWQWNLAGNNPGATGTSGGATAGKSLVGSGGGSAYGGLGSPGVYGSNGSPVQQVGQDPFSQLITGSIADLLERGGQSEDGADLMATLREIIAAGGQLPGNGAGGKRFESARELMAKGERTAMNDARAMLADRGLLSEPGNASGAEMSTIGRVQSRNAEEFARALRDIGIEEDDASNTRLTNALALAAGIDAQRASTLINAIGQGTDRQQMLSEVALASLGQNMAWNQFLAEYGLDRDKAMYAIQNGQIDQIMPYLALFMQLAQGTQRGYV